MHAKIQQPDEDKERLWEIYALYKAGVASWLDIRALPERKLREMPPGERENSV